MRDKVLGKGVGLGHGGNTANLPLIKNVDAWIDQAMPHLRIGIEPDSKFYKAGKLSIILSRHPVTTAYHLSISRTDRYPNWDEIAYVRYELVPDEAMMVMALPSKRDYINLHNFCFHLHQIPYDVWNGER